MWVWVTVLGLLVEVGVIVVLGRAATRGSEQDAPHASAGPAPVAPSARSAIGRSAIRRAGPHAGPAARR
jgi:hypothetical protein